ncbi:site-specific integrase [Lysinibacillus sphaericus]|uniref:site-specific integrase n=1 Tax=Lysinibacillus sphaericus TaxID=1421 RepID=UPI0021626BF4|nr:site-specific integrase [Lysinibacillus sphaericus]MCS1381892.1 site-specific integrase [Lysinibacillus sphaericus]
MPSLRGKEADKNYLTPEQLSILLNHIKQHEDIAYYSLFLTIAYTGMRKGEALGLQWRNIDFTNQTITIISPNTIKPFASTGLNATFNRIVSAVGLPATTIHGLRHTHATILMNNDIPVKAIAERLGNTPEIIHTTYGHVLKEMEDKIIDIFDCAIGNGAKNWASS